MKLPPSARTQGIEPSPTLALDARAKAMKAEGRQVVNLAIGEPDFETPEHIRQAAIKAIKDGFTRYTPSEGILPLREAMAEKFRVENGLEYPPADIVVTNGGKHALYNAMQALFGPGDEVIVPSPYWVTYPAQILLSGATPVYAPTSPERGYVLGPEELERAITPRTRGLILNSPSNPTGMVATRSDILALGEVLRDRPIWVISDDIYEKLLYDGEEFANIAMCCPELRDRTIICHSLSKTYSMTGWRIGFLAAPKEIARIVKDIQSQMTSNPCSIAQKAALAALTGTQEPLQKMRGVFDRRRKLVLGLIKKIPGFATTATPKGAFYVFPDASGLMGKTLGGTTIASSEDLASVLLKECEVASVPGSAFGQEGSLRFSYAASEKEIVNGFERIANFLAPAESPPPSEDKGWLKRAMP
ncbi:MAG: pyridoxal phosphate-dependent aminotransferase [Deltaproteobacteria bacterium]|jgi:aspartate aminotransferase|nr:pyridoxal phosphate-dependent aminotransferase [Deltaproteobacteria bacterium]